MYRLSVMLEFFHGEISVKSYLYCTTLGKIFLCQTSASIETSLGISEHLCKLSRT